MPETSLNLEEILQHIAGIKASDLHFSVGSRPTARVHGSLHPLVKWDVLTPAMTEQAVRQCLSDEKIMILEEMGEVDSAFSMKGLGRYRVNAFKQRGTYAIAIRQQPFEIPKFETLGLPESVRKFSDLKRGMVLVTGTTGSGKSTTLASLIDIINTNKQGHIITIEDPIEYLHKHKNCIVNQREIGLDSDSFANALRATLREDPDVILVGEMRDLETIQIALTAAETGHVVFSTLHTLGAAKTVDRIIDVFPPAQQNQIRNQLATVLEGVVTQQLIPKKDESGIAAACEVLVMTPAARNLIREGKPHQINSIIQTGIAQGMMSMDMSITHLVNSGIITREEANLRYTRNKPAIGGVR